MTPKELLSKATEAMNAKDFLLASQLFTKILNKFPNHVAANKGMQKLKKITTNTTQDTHNFTLEEAINELKKGNYQNAINLSLKFQLTNPDNPLVYNLIGICYVNQQNPKEAVPYFRTALRLNKRYSEAKANLGSALLLIGKMEDSILQLEESLKENPNNAMAWNSLGNARRAIDQPVKAEESFKAALNLDPNYVNALNSYGVLLSEQREYTKSISLLEKAVKLSPLDREVNQNFAEALSGDGQTESAIKILNKIAELNNSDPNPNALVQIADLEARIGNLEKSKKLLQNVMDSFPEYFKAYRSFSSINKFKYPDKIITKMEKYFKSTSLSDEDVIQLGFSLGKAYYDISEFDKSFQAYSRANKARRKQLNYSSLDFSERINIIKSTFNKQWYNNFSNFIKPCTKPIFILGMNRSGTTLVEQIVSAHSLVTGGGEIPYINSHCMKEINQIKTWGDGKLNSFYENYLEKLNSIDQKIPFVTDKMPSNFAWIGLIKTVFPKAKIIHLIRDPMDTCLSNYRNYFSSSGNGFAYDQIELAEFYYQYRKIMHYWYSLFPNEIFSCDYDHLVNDQETVTRKILNYCDLTFEPEVLRFYKNKRTVKTASVAQVRNPIYKSSISGWRKYEKHLSPMLNRLNELGCLEPWDIKSIS